MTDLTITLSMGEAHQTLRALGARKSKFRNAVDEETLKAILSAQGKVVQAINAHNEELHAPPVPVGVDTPAEKPVPSTRKRRTAKKED